MSFQWIIDRAESISIDRQEVVGQTITRDLTVRASSRGSASWRFTVKLPDGISWTELRPFISQAEKLGRHNTATISLSTAGQSWLYRYQGEAANITGFNATWVKGQSAITLTTVPTIQNGKFTFRAGDFVQLGVSGKVYTVAADVIAPATVVQLHRPIEESNATGVAIRVAQNCIWTVICTQFPQFTLFARDQVSFDGPFIFYENRV
jgi:hypothetical protein